MRRFLAGALSVLALVAGSALIAAPAHADTMTIEHTTTASDPTPHRWPGTGLCNQSPQWNTVGPHVMIATATVTVSGTYDFVDQWAPNDSQIVIFEGPYNPADISNCLLAIDEIAGLWMDAGIEYGLLLGPWVGGAATGTYRYSVDGPGLMQFAAATLPSATAVTPSTISAVSGNSIDLAATVTIPGVTADLTGTIEFFTGTTSLGTTPVAADGTASLPVTLPTGTHSITGTYQGTAAIDPSTSSATIVTITAAPVAPAAPPAATLPYMGADIGHLLISGVLLAAIGTLTLFMTRRRLA